MKQGSLFRGLNSLIETPKPEHDGPGLEPSDQARLSTLLERVRAFMVFGRFIIDVDEHEERELWTKVDLTPVEFAERWFTLREISSYTGGSEASVSARLRDLRKPKFGGWDVQRRHRGDPKKGLFEYRAVASDRGGA